MARSRACQHTSADEGPAADDRSFHDKNSPQAMLQLIRQRHMQALLAKTTDVRLADGGAA